MASKIGKRKAETPNISPKVPTKVNKKEVKIEELSKKQVIEKYKKLEAEYEKIVKQKVLLEEKVRSMEDKEKESSVKNTAETQTESDDNDIEFACKVCIYEAVCVAELGWHLKSKHGIGDPDYEYNFACNICRKPFDIKSDLMYHVKKEHPRSMPFCKYFQKGECNFTDDKCWYTHQMENIAMKQFKCGICGNVFNTKHEFMAHRRIEHMDQVQQCLNYKNGKCRFDKNCWYIHSDDTDESFSEY